MVIVAGTSGVEFGVAGEIVGGGVCWDRRGGRLEGFARFGMRVLLGFDHVCAFLRFAHWARVKKARLMVGDG